MAYIRDAAVPSIKQLQCHKHATQKRLLKGEDKRKKADNNKQLKGTLRRTLGATFHDTHRKKGDDRRERKKLRRLVPNRRAIMSLREEQESDDDNDISVAVSPVKEKNTVINRNATCIDGRINDSDRMNIPFVECHNSISVNQMEKEKENDIEVALEMQT